MVIFREEHIFYKLRMTMQREKSTSKPSASSSRGGKHNNNGGGNHNNNGVNEFECNICFELADYPIVTLCGHLFCWPCLYIWLQLHSRSQECPVCKGLIQKDKLVPIYGRSKSQTDPRSRPVPGVDIPNRPHGQRPQTAQPPPSPPQEQNYFTNLRLGYLGENLRLGYLGEYLRLGYLGEYLSSLCEFLPFAAYVTMGTAFGGLLPAFNFQLGIPDDFSMTHGYPFGYTHTFDEANDNLDQSGPSGHERHRSNWQDSMLKGLLVLIGLFVFLSLFWS